MVVVAVGVAIWLTSTLLALAVMTGGAQQRSRQVPREQETAEREPLDRV